MQKEIKYTGFTETPSDYECPDGDLATVVGMVPEDAALKPIQQPSTLFTLPDGYTVVFIHKNTGYKHYIVCHDDDGNMSYYWLASFEPQQVFTPEDFTEANHIADFQDKTIYDINAVGNILIFSTDSLYYHLWKNDNYKFIGNKIPTPEIDFKLFYFGIQNEYGVADDILTGRTIGETVHVHVVEGQTDAYKDLVLGLYNKACSEIKKLNCFYQPYFLCYALQLYDMSYTYISVPILMFPSVRRNTRTGRNEVGEGFSINVGYSRLRYQASYDYSEWSDIVKGVTVFVSQGVEINDTENLHPTERVEVRIPSEGYWYDRIEDEYFQTELSQNINRGEFIPFDMNGDTKTFEKLKDTHVFYKISELSIKEQIDTWRDVPIKDGVVTNLVLQEQMPFDYYSNCSVVGKHLFTYNSRLIMGDVSRTFYEEAYKYVAYQPESEAKRYIVQITVVTPQGDRIVKFPMETKEPIDLYYYYPDPRANLLEIFDADTEECLLHVELEKHPFLNGAYFMDYTKLPTTPSSAESSGNSSGGFSGGSSSGGFSGSGTRGTTRGVAITLGTVIEQEKWDEILSNKLYISEVGNPFVFSTNGIITIGVGTILGIRPAVKAMSPSQYGQFKFYVFSSDGVWAMEVTSDGYLEHPQLVTPDIVLGNGDSITQIDGAVLFATDRGIMLISGSDSICISDMLNSSTPFRPIGPTPEEDLLPGLRNVAGELLEEIQMDVFRNFITDCRMTYDYPHQRIIVYSPTHDYAYVYSLKSKQWGMMPSKIESTPLNYPAALAMVSGEDGKNVLVDYSKDDIVDGVTRVENGLIITRPLKLDYPDVLKTVDTVIQRGKFQTGHVKSILYGSRDLLNWQLVWSSVDQYLRGFSGTPYKYFRLALLCDLQEGEDLMGCTVQFTPRLTDQLR